MILLAARMIVARRDGELAMLRARGGSLRRVAALMLGGAVVAAGPGVLVGAGLAIAVVPGGGASSAGWPLAGIAVLAALAGPPLIAGWRHRRPAPASNPARITSAETRRPAPRWRRPVAEVTAIAASVAGLVVLHDQGVPASGGNGSPTGVDLYLTAVPVLVAVPVVVVMLRLYPLAIRGLLALSARGAGATGFVALARAARSSLTGALPAFALVLSLSLATFAGMVSQGITRGEIAASWHATGADAVIRPGLNPRPISAAAVTAIGAVPGVRHAAAVWTTNWVTPSGQPVTVAAVNPAGYAAVTADTPFPAFPAARLGSAPSIPSTPSSVPVLASPSAAGVLGTKAVQLSTPSGMGPLRVRVAGILSDTPAQPGGGAFVVMPLEALPGPGGQPAPNMLLVTGSGINLARLTAVANRVIPGNVITFRTAVLATLASSPLQHGAGLIITLIIATAAALGLFIVILALALGSAERGLTLARNVALPMRLAGGGRAKRQARSAELLDLLGLGDCLHRRPDQLSGGEQQRAAIAVALVNEPKVLLADEPTGELDTATAAEVFGALQRANTELGVTVLIVTHDPAVSSVVRRVVAIRDGRTSTETHRHATTGDDGEVAQHAVEYAVLDRAGRLQLPREMTEPLGLRNLVRLKAEPDHIGVWPDRREPG